MWSDDQFKSFLSIQGQDSQWHTVVIPGMKQAIIYTLQTTQDQIESRKNSFEIYGADFMLGRMVSLKMTYSNAIYCMSYSQFQHASYFIHQRFLLRGP